MKKNKIWRYLTTVPVSVWWILDKVEEHMQKKKEDGK